MQFRKAGWKILFVPEVEITHVKGVPTASHPFRVEYHKHRGMIYFYSKFFRHQYPGIMMWMVTGFVWLRFLCRFLKLCFISLKSVKPTWNWLEDSRVQPQSFQQKNTPEKTILVTGATNQVGRFLLPLLVRNGYQVHAVSRNRQMSLNHPGSEIIWHQIDINDHNMPDIDAAVLIHIAPLQALPSLLPKLVSQKLQRVIAFGTTSRFTKAVSKNKKEQKIAEQYTISENLLTEKCRELGLFWTIFRPTLIYGCGRDKNISSIQSFIRRFHFFPLAGKASGLRQPVHANDLAMACLQALSTPITHNNAYNLSGGNTLSYSAMVETIFHAMEKKPRFLRVPLFLFKFFLFCLSRLPGYSYLTPEMADRINQDLCFDHHQAIDDFDYHPRPFDETQVGNLP